MERLKKSTGNHISGVNIEQIQRITSATKPIFTASSGISKSFFTEIQAKVEGFARIYSDDFYAFYGHKLVSSFKDRKQLLEFLAKNTSNLLFYSVSSHSAYLADNSGSLVPIMVKEDDLSSPATILKPISKDGVLKLYPMPTNNVDCQAFVDTLNFTLRIEAFHDFADMPILEFFERNKLDYELEIVHLLSQYLYSIFGFGSVHERKVGLNRYDRSFKLGVPEVGKADSLANYGFVCIGGNNNTVMVSLTGTGLGAAVSGWESRLKEFAQSLQDKYSDRAFKITRVDLAKDFFNGEYDIESMLQDYYDGGFTLNKKRPTLFKDGYGWENPECLGEGRTIYIGKRKNSRYIRGYEKGKQLGDPNSPWFRFELELKSADLIIPLDVLTNPGNYLALYPAISRNSAFRGVQPKKIELKAKVKNITFAHVVKWFIRQNSRILNLFKQLHISDEKIIGLRNVNTGIVKRLEGAVYDCRFLDDENNRYLRKLGLISKLNPSH